MYQRPSFYFPPLRETPAVMALLLLCLAFFLVEFIGGQAQIGLSLIDVYAWPVSMDWFSTLHFWQPFTYPFVHSQNNFMGLLADGILLYFFGSSLERGWGTTRFLLFFFVSAVLVGLIVLALNLHSEFAPLLSGLGPGLWVTITVAFATLNPFASVYVMMLIPIQARFIALITIAVEIFAYYSFYGGPIQAILAVAALSLFAFAFTSRDFRRAFSHSSGGPKGPSLRERFDRWQKRRRMREWQKRVSRIDKPEDLFKNK